MPCALGPPSLERRSPHRPHRVLLERVNFWCSNKSIPPPPGLSRLRGCPRANPQAISNVVAALDSYTVRKRTQRHTETLHL